MGGHQEDNPRGLSQVKVAQPDLYYGDREKLDDWIMQLKLYLTFKETTIGKPEKVIFAISYLRGRAQKWVAPYWRQNDDADEEDVQWLKDLGKFIKEILMLALLACRA